MKEKILMQKIKDFIIKECNKEFGYAGVAETDEFIMINSGDKNLVFKIILKED